MKGIEATCIATPNCIVTPPSTALLPTVIMATKTSFHVNSSSHHAKSSNLRGTSKDVHGIIKINFAFNLCTQVFSLTKVHASRVGGTQMKPMMKLNHKKTEANTVSGLDLGTMVNDGFVYRQNIYIRSYEIGPDRKASVETLLNHLQETSLNHLKTIGILLDGYGLTPEMYKKNLIWVVAKMQVEVDRYPAWGDVVQIDTWKAAYGKIGMYCNWVVSDSTTSGILLKASCLWAMMNKETRRITKIPNEVRVELEQYLVDTPPIVNHNAVRLSNQDENITHHVCNGLTPRWSDLDVNHHVNNVKYSGWIIESVPKTIMKDYELASITLEYSQECWMDSVLQSHTFVNETDHCKSANCSHIDCEHLLQLENGGGNGLIMKGRTRWRLK